MAGAFRRVPIWITVGGLALFLSGVALFIGTIDTLRRRCPRCAADRQDRCRRNTEARRIDQRHIGRTRTSRRLNRRRAHQFACAASPLFAWT